MFSQSIWEKQNFGRKKVSEAKDQLENFQFKKAEETLKNISVYSLNSKLDKDDFHFIKFFIELHKKNFDKAEEYYDEFKYSSNKDNYNELTKKYANNFYNEAVELAENKNYAKASKKFYLSHQIRKEFTSTFSPKSLYAAAYYAELGEAYNDAIKYYKLILNNGYTRKYDYLAWEINRKEGERPEMKIKKFKNKYTRDKAIKENGLERPSYQLTEDYKKYFVRLTVCYKKNNNLETAIKLIDEEIEKSPSDRYRLGDYKKYLQENTK